VPTSPFLDCPVLTVGKTTPSVATVRKQYFFHHIRFHFLIAQPEFPIRILDSRIVPLS
jgi:hypothetical protein